jgi:steroid delta-isomerase-like uncharacterized protein
VRIGRRAAEREKEVSVAEARQIMDRVTEAINSHDADAVAACFSQDAVVIDPFGRTEGREQIAEYWRGLFEAFPDLRGGAERTYESGKTATDEWTFTGTHEGPLRTPDGESIPPTGKQVRLRGSDFATVENGLIVEDRAYFDQVEMLGQLGLLPQEAAQTSA